MFFLFFLLQNFSSPSPSQIFLLFSSTTSGFYYSTRNSKIQTSRRMERMRTWQTRQGEGAEGAGGDVLHTTQTVRANTESYVLRDSFNSPDRDALVFILDLTPDMSYASTSYIALPTLTVVGTSFHAPNSACSRHVISCTVTSSYSRHIRFICLICL